MSFIRHIENTLLGYVDVKELENMDHWKHEASLANMWNVSKLEGPSKSTSNESSSDGYFPGPYFWHTNDIVCNDNYYVMLIMLF